MRNLSLAGLPPPDVRAKGDGMAFTVREDVQGLVDLNGDGDTWDYVLHAYDHTSGEVTNLREHTTVFLVDGPYTAFLVEEWERAQDLNADGDKKDAIIHYHDARTGVTRNLGLAVTLGSANGKPDHHIGFQLNGEVLAVFVNEFDQGKVDLSGNGTVSDDVPHVVDLATGNITNLGFAVVDAYSGQGPLVDDNRVAFAVSEQREGLDLNADGDQLDDVLHVFDTQAGGTTNTAYAARVQLGLLPQGHRARLDRGWLAFVVNELNHGAVDLNGDGDASDFVLVLYRVATGQLRVLGALYQPGGGWGGFGTFTLGYGMVAFGLGEGAGVGMDMNGDGDTQDAVLHTHALRTGITMRSGHSLDYDGELLIGRGAVAFMVAEKDDGRDLNGDGDLMDKTPFVVDTTTGRVFGTGLAVAYSAPELSARGGVLAFAVPESAQGGTDLNGDGDTQDHVLHVAQSMGNSLVVRNVGRAIEYYPATPMPFVAATEGHVLFAVSEYFHGQTDLNRDGDLLDSVLFTYDVRAATLWNSSRAGLPETVLGRGFAGWIVDETGSGGVDLNGDGDAFDCVMHVVGLDD
jgi:hypothetical protein